MQRHLKFAEKNIDQREKERAKRMEKGDFRVAAAVSVYM